MKPNQQSKDGTHNEDRYTGEAHLYTVTRGGCLAVWRGDVGLYAGHHDMVFRQRGVAVLACVAPGDDDGLRRGGELVVADEQAVVETEARGLLIAREREPPTPRHASGWPPRPYRSPSRCGPSPR